MWTRASPTEKKSQEKREREREKSGKESQSPLCWFCKSATSAAYFLPKHCSVEWSPQMGPFLIFVAMHYQVHWCMCALIAHSRTGCMRCLWEGGYSRTVRQVWQHDAVGRGTLHSQSMADTVAARDLCCLCLHASWKTEGTTKMWIFHGAWEIPTLIHNYMVADSLLQTTNSALKLQPRGKPGVKVPYHLLLSSLITIKHCSRWYFFNISSPHHENEP